MTLHLTRRSAFRNLIALLTIVSLAFAFSGDATAKKKKKKNKDKETAAASWEEIGIPSFDEVFTKAKHIDDNLTAARTQLKTIDTELLTALGAAEGVSLGDALGELKTKAAGKITMKIEGGAPALSADDAPDDVKAAVAAINTGVAKYAKLIKNLGELQNQGKELVTAATALPAKAPAEAKSAGISPMKLPGVIKNVSKNVKNTTKIPANAAGLLTDTKASLDSIIGAFR